MGMRAAFLNVFKPQKIEDNGVIKLKYNATLLWPKGNDLIGFMVDGKQFNVMEEAARVATEQWGDKAGELIKSGVIKSPFLDGDGPQGVSKKTGERHKGFAGHRFIRASANEDRKPDLTLNVLGADNKLVRATDPNSIYSGCLVNVVVNLYGWEHAKNGKGLSFGLSAVQFAGDGERLGGSGGANADSFFEGVKAPDAAAAKAVAEGAGAGGLFA
jgi:hypothetical protein